MLEELRCRMPKQGNDCGHHTSYGGQHRHHRCEKSNQRLSFPLDCGELGLDVDDDRIYARFHLAGPLIFWQRRVHRKHRIVKKENPGDSRLSQDALFFFCEVGDSIEHQRLCDRGEYRVFVFFTSQRGEQRCPGFESPSSEPLQIFNRRAARSKIVPAMVHKRSVLGFSFALLKSKRLSMVTVRKIASRAAKGTTSRGIIATQIPRGSRDAFPAARDGGESEADLAPDAHAAIG